MAIQIKHPFISAKGDGTDATLVRPSNWNALHTTSMATNSILGRATAGTGVFEELPTSAAVIALLAAADLATFTSLVGGAETGDVKFSIQPTAAAGWIVYSLSTAGGTIGDASSSATVRANVDCSALFQLIWNSIADADCPVPGGRGGTAAADWAAHKQINLPWIPGRTIIGNAGGVSLTTRVIGRVYGEETHALTSGENATHTHANSLNETAHHHTKSAPNMVANGPSGGGGPPNCTGDAGGLTGDTLTNITITNASSGSGTGHNNMQPSIALWAKVKL